MVINWDFDPIIFRINDVLQIRYYSLLFAFGVFAGYYLVKHIYEKEQIAISSLEKLSTYIIVGIILGARLGHCLFYEFSYYSQHLIEIFLPIKMIAGTYKFIGFQGLASHGGGIGVIIAIIAYSFKYKTNIIWILDRIAIATPVTGAFIRLGNFMNSEVYGKPTNGNWGVIFKRDDLIPRHPTQLYEAFAYFVISILLMFLYKKSVDKKLNGLIIGTLLVLLFFARFVIEFFKENQVAFEKQMVFNMGQLLSIPFIIIGILILIRYYIAKNTVAS